MNAHQNILDQAKKLLDSEQFQQANDLLKANISQFFNGDEFFELYAASFEGIGRLSEAYAHYSLAIERLKQNGKDCLNAYIALVGVCLQLDYNEAAFETFENAIQDYPETVTLFELRGELYLHMGYYKEALNDLKKACSLDKTNKHTVYLLASAYFKLKEYEAAHAYLDLLLKYNFQPKDVLYKKGAAFYQQDQYEKALEYYNKAVEEGFNEVILFFERAMVLSYLGYFDEALTDMNHYLQHMPDNLVATHQKGLFLENMNELGTALECYNKVLAADPDFNSSYYNRGGIWLNMEEFSKAEQDYDKYIAHNNNNSGAYNNRGNAYSGLELHQKALEDYNKAIELSPEDSIPYGNRADVFLSLHQYENCLQDIETALQLDPLNGHPYYVLGSYYNKKENHTLAASYYRKAFHLNWRPKAMLGIFGETYPSPFLSYRLLQKLTAAKGLQPYFNNISSTAAECNNWLQLLTLIKQLPRLRPYSNDLIILEAIANYYMGDPFSAKEIFAQKLETKKHTPLSIYYFAKTTADCLEPLDQFELFVQQQSKNKTVLSAKDLYYLGQISRVAGKTDLAITFFNQSGNFIPSLYALAGIYHEQNNQTAFNKLIFKIQNTEFAEPEPLLLYGINNIIITHETTAATCKQECLLRLYYFELTDEINLVCNTLSQHAHYRHCDFSQLIAFSEALQETLTNNLHLNECRKIEAELVTSFTRQFYNTNDNGVQTFIERNAKAKETIQRIAANHTRFNTGYVQELAESIYKLNEPADWYLNLIKYHYLENLISAKSAVTLIAYAHHTAITKNNKSIESYIAHEIAALIPFNIFQSPTFLLFVAYIWNQNQHEDARFKFDDFKNYQLFRKNFRNSYLRSWSTGHFTQLLN